MRSLRGRAHRLLPGPDRYQSRDDRPMGLILAAIAVEVMWRATPVFPVLGSRPAFPRSSGQPGSFTHFAPLIVPAWRIRVPAFIGSTARSALRLSHKREHTTSPIPGRRLRQSDSYPCLGCY